MRRLRNDDGDAYRPFPSELPCASVSKRVRDHSNENDFALHENETTDRTHFQMKGFALRLFLKKRCKRTRKWPIKKNILTLYLTISPLASSTQRICRVLNKKKLPQEKKT